MIGVVIGDSIAEGYPYLSGRLRPDGVATYNPDWPDKTGQFSREFTRLFGFRFYNHGITGDTTTGVWARWNRDVLAQTYDPDDGRGSKTLLEVPGIVFINVGINDVYLNVALNTMKANFTSMLDSLAANNIEGIINNIAYGNSMNGTQRSQVDSFNSWLDTKISTYVNCVKFDINNWSRDCNALTQLRPDYYCDGIHLFKEGCFRVSQFIYETYINS